MWLRADCGSHELVIWAIKDQTNPCQRATIEKFLGVYHPTPCPDAGTLFLCTYSVPRLGLSLCSDCGSKFFGIDFEAAFLAESLTSTTQVFREVEASVRVTVAEQKEHKWFCQYEGCHHPPFRKHPFAGNLCARHLLPYLPWDQLKHDFPRLKKTYPELRAPRHKTRPFPLRDYLPKISPDGEEIDHLANIRNACRQDDHLLSMVYPPYAELAELGRLAARGVQTNPEKVAHLQRLCREKGLIP